MTDPADHDPSAPPYTTASLARLIVATRARDLAERAGALVPIGTNELRPDGKTTYPGETLMMAAGLLSEAEQLFLAAAVAERMAGTTWELIGDVRDTSRSAAQERFGPAETEFREHLAWPENPDYTGEIGQLRYRLDRAALNPDAVAAELDAWVRARCDDHDAEPDSRPVSGGLVRMDTAAELAYLSDLSHQLWKATDGVPRADRRLAIAERQLQLWEHNAAQRPRSRTAREMVEHGRREVSSLREQAFTAGIAVADWSIRAQVRLRGDVVTGGPRGTRRTATAGNELVMLMRGRAGEPVAMDAWETDEPAEQALIVGVDHAQVLDVLEASSPWPYREDVELVTESMRADLP